MGAERPCLPGQLAAGRGGHQLVAHAQPEAQQWIEAPQSGATQTNQKQAGQCCNSKGRIGVKLAATEGARQLMLVPVLQALIQEQLHEVSNVHLGLLC